MYVDFRIFGIENFKIETIDTCNTQEEADILEEKYIIENNCTYPSIGYNKVKCAMGGDTLSNNKNIKEISKKISEIKIGSKNHMSKPVKLTIIKTNEVKIFESAALCAKWIGEDYASIADSSIKRKCNGVIKNNVVHKRYIVEWANL